jgi:serine/threonine protein phosphatase PrpC
LKGRRIYPFNVGDSRCILIRFKSLEHKKDYVSQNNSKIISKPTPRNEEQKFIFQNVNPSIFKSMREFSAGQLSDENESKFEAVALTIDHS